MISLDSAFEDACGKHPHLKLLESQWRFDKELISKALQNIGSMFPHYSRHDASHSKQITVNIERLLGNKIINLTATDMWLILEAAYNHDIGMVITSKQIQDMDSPEFTLFVNDIVANSSHPSHQFAKEWMNDRAILPKGSNAHIFLNKYTHLISEWYRLKHPENSALIVNNPLFEIGLDSPRNELLPKRLFGVLASICNAHGQPFDEVMKLPFSEAGMATEDCHPRYVAFLLRMGDLLDVDDNRFCPVMMKTNSAGLPVDSRAHFDKHQSIKHLRLDSERIEIEAVCPSPESYEVSYEWFKWLEEEHHKQSQNWEKIVPSNNHGRLPTLSSPLVTIKKPYLIVNKGKKPGFNIDQEAILKLLRSTGLYKNKIDSVREILQNAVDSTLLAIWEKHSEDINKLNPSSDQLQEIYRNYKITANLRQDENDRNLFLLSVSDSGAGISQEDLRHILQVGSSGKNRRKSRLIADMPLWFRPSGNFGIGLQSIYLLSDSFSITTKSRSTHQALKISFNSGKSQTVTIEELRPEKVEYGAKIEVKVRMEEFPQSISFSFDWRASQLQDVLSRYDFTQPESNLRDYEEINIWNAIYQFNFGSPIKINAGGSVLKTDRGNIFFSDDVNVVLSDVKFIYSDHANIKTLFRGQPFDDLLQSLGLASCVVDYYGYQASDFLTYNRDKILPEAKTKATQDLKDALLCYIEKNFDSIHDEEKPCAAAFHFLHSGPRDRHIKYDDQLHNFLITTGDGEKHTLRNMLEDIKSKKISSLEIIDLHTGSNLQPDKLSNTLAHGAPRTSLSIITYLATKNGMYWQECQGSSYNSNFRLWSDEDIQPVCNDLFKKILANKNGFDIGNRLLFPAWGKYRSLTAKWDRPWTRAHHHMSYKEEYMVLPCIFAGEGSVVFDQGKDLISWVFAHRFYENVTVNEIEQLYASLASDLHAIVQGN